MWSLNSSVSLVVLGGPGRHTVVVAGLGLEGAEGLDLGHAAPGAVRVAGAVLRRLLAQTRIQVHHFGWRRKHNL